ncbi:hypothetical protein KTE28_04660 [Burkholderia multivorans]|jgi:hypothetical protein|uniref:gp53-like domain-containing protein n=1 Tax=Burkholderia multivorans TaxID=87883 RepID=UPI001C24C1B6|nr:hypothetical protein [Burkholderia multivorans]MBU9373613.1 hypothetical protein [Burkholderia multivorans]MBU9617658.1 hypothetical protein [Burkholderia multivorans]MDN7607748.1 hypothetical protein [Burkholderia multivorans]
MADLVEASKWEAGIYQLETSDPVEAGPDGIDNLQARQLGNRTRYLKDQHDAHIAAEDPHPQYATHADLAEKVAALVAQSPETLDTLSELATALGNDPNFATTIANQLALKAPLDSPAFVGAPKGTTPPRFDNSKRLVTTEFLKAAGFQFPGFITVTADTELSSAVLNGVVNCSGAGPFTITLPSLADCPVGTTLSFVVSATAGVTVAARPGDQFSGNVKSVAMGPGDTLVMMAAGGGYWWRLAGSTQLVGGGSGGVFGTSLGSSGYQKLPSGLILQWGFRAVLTSVPAKSSASAAWTFPLAFPNACLFAVAIPANNVGTSATVEGLSRTVAGGFVYNNGDATASLYTSYIAIGY